MPIFYASYCRKRARNPLFDHEFIMLSKRDDNVDRIEVTDAYGLHGTAPSKKHQSWMDTVRSFFGISFDYENTYGATKRETLHHLSDDGLFALNFEITEALYDALKNDFNTEIATQEPIIDELRERLKNKGIAYPTGSEIFHEEGLRKRLAPFNLEVTINKKGVGTSNSRLCKHYAVNALRTHNIIDDAIVQQLLPPKHPLQALSYWEGIKKLPVRLVATGEYGKNDLGERTWENNHLWWATPLILFSHVNDKHRVYRRDHQQITETLNMHVAIERKLHRTTNDTVKKRLEEILSEFSRFSLLSASDETKLHQIDIANKNLKAMHIAIDNPAFFVRLWNSPHIKVASIALIILFIGLAFIDTPLGITAAATATLAASHQLYGFFKTERFHHDCVREYQRSTFAPSHASSSE